MTDRYIHYLEAMKSLNRAWRVLTALQQDSDQSEVWMAAYRMCLVDYAKPFKRSNGIKEKSLKLIVPDLPPHLKETHDYVIDARDRLIAHSDLEPLNVQFFYGSRSDRGLPPIICTDVPSFPVIELMIELVEFVIKELSKLEGQYAET